MDASPVAVTVFPDRARVTRLGHVALQPGLHKIEIANLPLRLLADSVRATGRGTARAKLLGVTTRLENFLETPAEAARNLESQILAVEDTDADLAARAAVLEKERGFLEGLAAQSEMFARGLALGYRTAEEQGTIFDFVRGRLSALQTELLQIARGRREGAKELDRLRRELQSVQAERPRQRYVATVELEVSEAGGLDLELTYVVTGASWQPLYDLRLTEAGLALTYLAQVAQQTGEDWKDVSLTLSTAQPALALIIPELNPWYVAPRMVYAAKRAALPMQAASFGAGMPAELRSPEAPPPPAPMPAAEPVRMEEAVVSEAGVALTYQLSGRADIPGTNDPRKVTVANFPLKPELDYVTAPRNEAVCYRRATVTNDSRYSLLPGAAQLFEGEDYLGATRLEFVAPGQEFELALGADERLRVERKLAAREVDKTFIGDRRRLRYAYTIELENLRDSAQIVVVRDQFPVARDEQVKVRLEACEPKPAEQTDLNLLEWQLTLAPRAKQTVRFEFSVEHPRALDVTGLP